jgi:3'-5' exoribonuclease
MKFIKDLKEGEKIVEFYLVEDKQLKTKKNGEEYISVTLKDKTGHIPAVLWDNIAEFRDTFQKEDFVKIEGLIGSYGNSVQMTIKKLRTVEEQDILEGFDRSNYFETTENDVNAMWEELLGIIETIENEYIKRLLEEIVKKNENEIKAFPAAQKIHHEYIGGFLEHTLSVAKSCDYFSGKYHKIDRNLLIAGAILHDIGKLRELSVSHITEYSHEGHLIGHIVLGRDMMREKAKEIDGFPKDLLLQLDHIILSHQGSLEWGSPKPPMTREALILHYVEDLDAKINIFNKVIKKDTGEGRFTKKNLLLGRSLYKD